MKSFYCVSTLTSEGEVLATDFDLDCALFQFEVKTNKQFKNEDFVIDYDEDNKLFVLALSDLKVDIGRMQMTDNKLTISEDEVINCFDEVFSYAKEVTDNIDTVSID